MGDYRAGTAELVEMSTFALGSCVGVTVYDPKVKVGGMLHAMLPTAAINHSDAKPFLPGKFVDTGLTNLFRDVIALGGDKNRLEVRLAGGSEFLNSSRIFKIGDRNVAAVRAFLARRGIKLLAEDVGGTHARNLSLNLVAGKVIVHQVDTNKRFL